MNFLLWCIPTLKNLVCLSYFWIGIHATCDLIVVLWPIHTSKDRRHKKECSKGNDSENFCEVHLERKEKCRRHNGKPSLDAIEESRWRVLTSMMIALTVVLILFYGSMISNVEGMLANVDADAIVIWFVQMSSDKFFLQFWNMSRADQEETVVLRFQIIRWRSHPTMSW